MPARISIFKRRILKLFGVSIDDRTAFASLGARAAHATAPTTRDGERCGGATRAGAREQSRGF